MPRMDGTGPYGDGPRSGLGYRNNPNVNNNLDDRNYYYGRGMGCCCYYSNDKESLMAQKTLLEKRLAEIEAKLKKLGE